MTTLCLPDKLPLSEVVVRLVRGDERRRRDELMKKRHSLGFCYFAGRDLRYVVEMARHLAGPGGLADGCCIQE